MDFAGEFQHGAGAYWLDLTSDEWTWVPSWTLADLYDIQVDSQTGDVWFASTGAGVGVLRGWHKPADIPVFIGVETDRGEYSAGDTMRVLLDMPRAPDGAVDLYVALQTAWGDLLFYPAWGSLLEPFLSGLNIPAGTHLEDYELFSLTLPELCEGAYCWYAALAHAGSMDFASNIASCEWQFE